MMESTPVHIPPGLLHRTGNRRVVQMPGQTVREVIARLEENFPGLAFNLCQETGELRPFVNIFVGGENIRFMQHLETPIDPGVEVHIIHSVAGG